MSGMTRPARSAVGGGLAAALVGGWVVAVTGVLQALGWLADQALVVYVGDRPWWLWPAVSAVNAALVAAPAALLAVIPRSPAVRAAGRSWLAGGSAVGLLGAVRAVPGAEPELHLDRKSVV